MLPELQGGGGNSETMSQTLHPSRGSLILRRHAAIGDVICASTVADRLIEQGMAVTLQCHPVLHPLMRRHPRLTAVVNRGGYCHVDLDQSYERDPYRRQKTFHQMFFESANRQLAQFGLSLGPPRNCRPQLIVSADERKIVEHKISPYPKPWIFICPRSDSYAVRQVPDITWDAVARKLTGTCFWIGRHPAPDSIVDLKCKDIDIVALYLSLADLLVTVDTGPMHIAAALNIPIVAINQSSCPEQHLNDQNDFDMVSPEGLDCLNCQQNICVKDPDIPPCQKIDPDVIVEAVLRRFAGGISAVVPVYQPDADTLNRCLAAVVDQVDEVIVTMEAKSILPTGAMKHQKIRYVQTKEAGIGFGRNVNFGVRHSRGKYVLILNEDVFLQPGVVDGLMRHMHDNVGLACHLLRYTDGTIYPVAMARRPGDADWHHVDYRKYIPSISKPVELENCCGASFLVKREAFYKIGGFDENFFMYAEDNDLALRIRQAGHRIVFDPTLCATHVNGVSTGKLGIKREAMIAASGKLFHAKWDPYLRYNKFRVPGNFEYV